MPKLNGKTYAYTKKGKEKYKKALAKKIKDKRKGKEQSVDVDIRKSKKGNVELHRVAIDADDITNVSRGVYIKNPFKKDKNLYTRETSKTYNKKKNKAEKEIITKVGDKPYRVKYKRASKVGTMKDYLKTDKRIKRRRAKRN